MPTSSIFTDVVISDPKKVEEFIEALEASSLQAQKEPRRVPKPPLTDREAIRKLMSKRVKNSE